MTLCFLAMKDEFIWISAYDIAEFTCNLLSCICISIVTLLPSILLSSLNIQFALKLKGVRVVWLPPLITPLFVVALRKHHLQRWYVGEIVFLVFNNSNDMMISTFSKCKFVSKLWIIALVSIFFSFEKVTCCLLLFKDF